MAKGGIRIPEGAVTISVRRDPLRITYPRFGRMLPAAAALSGGTAVWLYQLPAGAWREPLQYALGLLFLAPGVWAAGWALRRRPVATASEGHLVVGCGFPFLERVVARLPLGTLEVQVATRSTEAVRYDAEALSKRFFAVVSPSAAGRLPKTEVPVHVVQVRNRGQEEWLSLFGSQVASEIESARLAIAEAALHAADVVDADDVSP